MQRDLDAISDISLDSEQSDDLINFTNHIKPEDVSVVFDDAAKLGGEEYASYLKQCWERDQLKNGKKRFIL